MMLEPKSKNEEKKEELFKEARRKQKTTKAPRKLSKEGNGDNYLRQGNAWPESRQQV